MKLFSYPIWFGVMLSALIAAGADSKSAKTAVQRLGFQTKSEDLAILTNNPAASVKLLIAELSLIPEKKILNAKQSDHEKAMHVIWCVRALRYLTGLDFHGTTGHRFSATEDEMARRDLLNRSKDGQVAFFAVWMSRDSIYVAPKDTQKEIIAKWKRSKGVRPSN